MTNPTHNRTTAQFWILGAILFLTGGYLLADGARLIPMDSAYPLVDLWYTRIPKVLVSFLCTLLAWTIGDDAFDSHDRRLLRISFSLSLVADIAFSTGHGPVGVAIFGVFQGVMARRSGSGLLDWWRRREPCRVKVGVFGASLLAVIVTLLVGVFYPTMQDKLPLLAGFSVYALLLGTSLWTAWASLVIRRFPRRNAWMIAIGMTLFFLCDLTVGLGNALEGTPWLVATSLTWVFYTPALVLLSLSGRRSLPAT